MEFIGELVWEFIFKFYKEKRYEPSRIFLLGLGQGGRVALDVAVKSSQHLGGVISSQHLGGVISISSCLSSTHSYPSSWNNGPTPILLLTSSDQSLIPQQDHQSLIPQQDLNLLKRLFKDTKIVYLNEDNQEGQVSRMQVKEIMTFLDRFLYLRNIQLEKMATLVN